VNQAERRPSSVRAVVPGRSRAPSVPVTRTVAARPLGVRATTAMSTSSPATTVASRCAASSSVSPNVQS
jgi:hypothetical protein